MLLIRTPFRISFFGGGTDFKEYYEQYGGCVIATSIDKYCYLTLRHLPPFFDYKSQLTYSKIERFNNPEELQHPLVRAALQYIETDRIQIAYDADLSACSGIGSSSSFAVGLLQGLHALKNEYPDKMTLAKEAIYLERVACDEAGGVQDQLAASFGGFNRYDFDGTDFRINPIKISDDKLKCFQDNLMLLFTGFTHYSGIVAKEQQKNISSKLGELDEMKSLVFEAEKILLNGELDDFGKLLDHTWFLKRSLSKKITTYEIDKIYSKAKEHGALGGKLLGAGGGGFMLLYVPKYKQKNLKKALKEFRFVPFKFENSGTQIIYKSSDAD